MMAIGMMIRSAALMKLASEHNAIVLDVLANILLTLTVRLQSEHTTHTLSKRSLSQFVAVTSRPSQE